MKLEPHGSSVGPLELGFSEPRSRCGEKDKVEKVSFPQGWEEHVPPANSSPVTPQHVCNPAPDTPPTPCSSHLITPSAPHIPLNSANARSQGRAVWNGTLRLTSTSPAPLGPPSRPKAWLPAGRGGERETPNLRLVWSSRTRANSGSGVLSWLREKPPHLLGR